MLNSVLQVNMNKRRNFDVPLLGVHKILISNFINQHINSLYCTVQYKQDIVFILFKS